MISTMSFYLKEPSVVATAIQFDGAGNVLILVIVFPLPMSNVLTLLPVTGSQTLKLSNIFSIKMDKKHLEYMLRICYYFY